MQIPSGWKTAQFREALGDRRFAEAETWLRHVRDHRDQFPQYDDGWFGDRERELIAAYSEHARSMNATVYYGFAKRIIEWSLNETHKESRRRRLTDISGIAYDRIILMPFVG